MPHEQESPQLTTEERIIEASVLDGGEREINRSVSRLKNGDELREFQKELLAKGYYKNLPTPKITAKTKSEIEDLQKMLAANGYADMLGTTGVNKDGIDGILGSKTRAAWAQYVKDHPSEALEQTVADGRVGPATRAAAKAYYNDVANGVMRQQAQPQTEEPIRDIVKETEFPLERIGDDSVLSFPEYLYRSGSVGAGRRIGNVVSAGRNLVNGFVNPHGHNATLSEGARRQMVAASIAGMQNRGKYGITDVEHQQLGGMEGHSGEEFRREGNMSGYISQMADAPYHNIYGQSGSTYNEDTQIFSPGTDAYTFNNQWTGNKVTKVYEDGEGSGSIKDAYDEYVRARESGATIKASLESAASVRGIDVKPKKGKSNEVSQKKLEKYKREYEKYLTDERFRRRFERKMNKNR